MTTHYNDCGCVWNFNPAITLGAWKLIRRCRFHSWCPFD